MEMHSGMGMSFILLAVVVNVVIITLVLVCWKKK
jgi:hypothetical protein